MSRRKVPPAPTSGSERELEIWQEEVRRNLNEKIEAGAVSEPSGGATVDTEARAAITSLISLLETAGILEE